jgi:hypothetical protein
MLQEGKKRFAQTMYHNSAFPFRETNSPRLAAGVVVLGSAYARLLSFLLL